MTSGFVIGLIEIILALSFGAFIFSGPLAPFSMNGIGLALMGALLSSIAVAVLTSFPGMVGGNQDAPAAIMAVTASAIAAGVAAGATTAHAFATVVVMIALTTTLTGLFMLGLGYFKLGRLVRFLPYPVIGGFLAGTGWLLIPGAMGLMVADVSIPALIRPEELVKWLPGAAIAIILTVSPRFSTHYFTLPGILLAAVALFYAVVWATGTPINTLEAEGWLLGPFPDQSFFQPLLVLNSLELVQWPAIFSQAANLLTILLISAFALLLNASGVSLAVEADIDLDRELQAAGVGNFAAGIFGGLVGFQQLSLSVLNFRLRADNRLPGLVAAGMVGLTLIFGAATLSFVPRFILGGLLLYLGLGFLIEWVVKTWYTFPRLDYAVIILIVLVIATVGFLEGVAVGIITTILLFVINYSRINVIRHVISGAQYQSRIMRPRRHQQLLHQHGDQLTIVELQGFIFFGTAQQLVDQIQSRIEDETRPDLRYLLLDFRLVTGIDSSANFGMAKLQRIAAADQIQLLLTHLSPDILARWEKEVFSDNQKPQVFPDLDQGVAWFENQVIARHVPADELARPHSIIQQLTEFIATAEEGLDPGRPDQGNLEQYMTRIELPAGAYIVHEGETGRGLYFLEEGQAVAQRTGANGVTQVMRIIEPGTVIGEIGVYAFMPTTADVVATESSVLLFLSLLNLNRMETNDPHLAITLHRLIAAMLGEKLAQTNYLVSALQG